MEIKGLWSDDAQRKAYEAGRRHRMALNRFYARITGKRLFWEYAIDSEDLSDGEYDSALEAERAAEDEWGNRCEDDGEMVNGESRDIDCYIAQGYRSERTGEFIIVAEKETIVSYEYYHGDYAEHFCQRDYI